MIQCRKGTGFQAGEDEAICQREARWEIRDDKSFSEPLYACNLHTLAALRRATVPRGMSITPATATVRRL